MGAFKWLAFGAAFLAWATVAVHVLPKYPFTADAMNLTATGVLWRLFWDEE